MRQTHDLATLEPPAVSGDIRGQYFALAHTGKGEITGSGAALSHGSTGGTARGSLFSDNLAGPLLLDSLETGHELFPIVPAFGLDLPANLANFFDNRVPGHS
jgi:hypothetical protein